MLDAMWSRNTAHDPSCERAMRFAKKRDESEAAIFDALQYAGCNPIRCTDFDIAASHVDGSGRMIECKTGKGRIRPLQAQLAAIFGDRYIVARTPEDALRACGIPPTRT